MPLQATSGAASYDAFGGGVPVVPAYIEEVFSTYLYTGNGSTQTITNGIDLSTKGGMVWNKCRSSNISNIVSDTNRGAGYRLITNTTDAQAYYSGFVSAFNSNGFSVGDASGVNEASQTFASWTFRKQPKFFDVVTYTGNGTNGRTVAHNLGSAPGCIIIKRTSATGPWYTWHRSLTADKVIYLNTTAAQADPPFGAGSWISSDSTTVTFPNVSIADVNNNGYDYVMYVLAHNAGGFGLTGTDNVISCGSYTGTGSPLSVTLGYEPQWILVKRTSTAGNDWILMDTMRGMSLTDASWLNPNTSAAESTGLGQQCNPTATGFDITSTGSNLNAGGATYIYIAIRRGPMKVPTDATKVYETGTQLSTSPSFVSGFPVDFAMRKYTGISDGWNQVTRLQGTVTLSSDSAAAETTGVTPFVFDYQTGWSSINSADSGIRSWMMRRAPSFMDVVCKNAPNNDTWYHNLGVKPDLIILKSRNSTFNWLVNYCSALPNAGTYTDLLRLNTTAAVSSNGGYSTVASINATSFNAFLDSTNWIAYLFATCAGVSKVGSYTGNGTTQTINCGFTGGARFVLIKRTDSTGGWYLYDTARGMTVLTDPYLFLNTADAETATLGSVTTVTTGFAVNASILAAINTNGANYIFLAIA